MDGRAGPPRGGGARHRAAPPGARRRRLPLALLLGGLAAPAAAPAGSPPPPPPPTSCVTVCGAELPDPCVLNFGVVVTAGSDIDCSTLEVIVDTNGALTVHDGAFTLRARRLRLQGTGQIVGDCPAGRREPGIEIHVAEDLVMAGNNAKLRADCGLGGGALTVAAKGAITVAANGMRADGTAAGAPGGVIRLAAGGTLGVGAEVSASAFDSQESVAAGGEITLTAGGNISTTGTLRAQGTNDTGGSITVESDAAVTLTGHAFADARRSGDGGQIELRGKSLLTTGRLVAKGVGDGSTGGTVQLEARGGAIDVRHDIIVKAHTAGGSITAEAPGPITIGTSGGGAFELNVTAHSNGGAGGELALLSAGDTVRVFATLVAADGVSGGAGGHLRLEGASVVAEAASTLKADATGQGIGGGIALVARDQMTLDGWLRATNGEAVFVYRATPPTIGPSVYPPWTARQEADLPPPCGDAVLRAGEPCDALNLGEDANG
jgi:hypothetical protein